MRKKDDISVLVRIIASPLNYLPSLGLTIRHPPAATIGYIPRSLDPA